MRSVSLITDICKRTRLWTAERVDVARELVAHFADGIDAGVSSDQLICAFGDPTQAARLIRRAKIRNRSMLWHAKRFCVRAACAVVVVYAALALWICSSKPTVSVDYVAQLNVTILATPEADRAWPFYRQAFPQIDDAFKPFKGDGVTFDRLFEARIGSPEMSELRVWLKDHQSLIDLIAAGTRKRALGFKLGHDGAAFEEGNPFGLRQDVSHSLGLAGVEERVNVSFGQSLLTVLLPYLNQSRSMCTLLIADARVAVTDGDTDRALERVANLLSLSEHMREGRSLVNQQVANRIEAATVDLVLDAIANAPDRFSTQQLIALAHRLPVIRRPSERLDLSFERMAFADWVQRSYTDDGNGDGHFTPDGLQALGAAIGYLGNLKRDELPVGTDMLGARAFSPVGYLVMPSRKSLMNEYNRRMTAAEQTLQHRPFEADLDRTEPGVETASRSAYDDLRFQLARAFVPNARRLAIHIEWKIAKLDAAQTAIALEVHRREHGRFPDSLAELVPTYLPKMPLDSTDGQPVRYKLVKGKPMLYSVGIDGDDDGGKLFIKDGKVANHRTQIGTAAKPTVPDGDWILYPEPQLRVDEDDDQDQPDGPATTPAE